MMRNWGSDFFGQLNDLPKEPLNIIASVLEAMRTQRTFRLARRELIADLRGLIMSPGGEVKILEAGCGTGASLPDIAELIPSASLYGVDYTRHFIGLAEERARSLGFSRATYVQGDIRSLDVLDGAFDAAFCDKLLLHVGPPEVVAGAMARAVKSGGLVGAIEWYPNFLLSTSKPSYLASFNEIFRKAVYNINAAANLERILRSAGLSIVGSKTYVAEAKSLDEEAFWRSFIVNQAPLFIHAGLISEAEAREIIADIEEINKRGEFHGSFIVRSSIGMKKPI
ncbi:MAG: methyltransferase domain-containing protein [Desulfurococcales archaeon]|nr:methyltransferase domain-containing protein [Desulfurococcales archaeon]